MFYSMLWQERYSATGGKNKVRKEKLIVSELTGLIPEVTTKILCIVKFITKDNE